MKNSKNHPTEKFLNSRLLLSED